MQLRSFVLVDAFIILCVFLVTCNPPLSVSCPVESLGESIRQPVHTVDGKGHKVLPPMVEDAFEGLVHEWTGKYPSLAEKDRFSRWFFDHNETRPQHVAYEFQNLLRYRLGIKGNGDVSKDRRERFKTYAKFIAVTKLVGQGFPRIDTYQKGTALQAIHKVGPVADLSPLEIHEMLLRTGWNPPFVTKYRHITYFWPSPDFQEIAVVRLDLSIKSLEMHVHKEILSTGFLLEKMSTPNIRYPHTPLTIRGFSDDGTERHDAIQIPLKAYDDLERVRNLVRDSSVSNSDLEEAMRNSFFPDVMAAIAEIKE